MLFCYCHMCRTVFSVCYIYFVGSDCDPKLLGHSAPCSSRTTRTGNFCRYSRSPDPETPFLTRPLATPPKSLPKKHGTVATVNSPFFFFFFGTLFVLPSRHKLWRAFRPTPPAIYFIIHYCLLVGDVFSFVLQIAPSIKSRFCVVYLFNF